jgi:hypothetical protein
MEVKDMFNRPRFNKLNQLLENRYNYSFDIPTMTVPAAKKMLRLIETKIKTVQQSHQIHLAERSPAYCQMLLMRESITTWLDERLLTEGELGEAEVILAAKNITDSVQKMVEQAGKIANEQLPALTTAIRDQIGMAQAEAYKNAVGQAIGELVTQLGTARDQLDMSVLALTGQDVQTDMSMPTPATPTPDGGEVPIPDAGAEPAGDDFAASDAEAGGTEPLGRARR